MVAHRRQWMPCWLPLSVAGQAINVLLDREAVEINQFFVKFIIFILNLWNVTSPNPFHSSQTQRLLAAGKGEMVHHGGDTCELCFASKKPSEREFFVHASRTDLGVSGDAKTKIIMPL